MDGGVGRGWFGGGCEGEFDGVAEDVEDVDGERWLVVGHLLAGFLVSQGFFGHDGDGPSTDHVQRWEVRVLDNWIVCAIFASFAASP